MSISSKIISRQISEILKEVQDAEELSIANIPRKDIGIFIILKSHIN